MKNKMTRAFWFLVWCVLRAYAVTRPRVTILANDGTTIVRRWFLTSRPVGDATGTPGWYLHHIVSPDPDPDPHNHPWEIATTRVLRGAYLEERSNVIAPRWVNHVHRLRSVGDPVPAFKRSIFHRVTHVRPNTWTLFHAGQKHGRGWGFLQDDNTIRAPRQGVAP